MENIKQFSNYRNILYNANNIKILFIKYIIIFLCFSSNNSLRTSINRIISFTDVNQILLKVKGESKSQVIYPKFNNKPYIYYLNDEPIPKRFKESSIDLPESENIVKLIFDDKVEDCSL